MVAHFPASANPGSVRPRSERLHFRQKSSGPNKRIADLTRPNALYLTTAANSNHDVLTGIYRWFNGGLRCVNLGLRDTPQLLARQLIGQEKRVGRMLRLADLGIRDAKVVRHAPDEVRREMIRKALERDIDSKTPNRERRIAEMLSSMDLDNVEVELIHRAAHGDVALPFEDESLGTRTWLILAVQVLKALEWGAAVVVDELDASLHPALMAEILRLFGDRRSNKLGAQLIFTTHDTWTLGRAGEHELSRGQIWFVEKDIAGSSVLTPLSEFRPRKGENIQRGYLQGRYGGVPRPEGSAMVEVAAAGSGSSD